MTVSVNSPAPESLDSRHEPVLWRCVGLVLAFIVCAVAMTQGLLPMLLALGLSFQVARSVRNRLSGPGSEASTPQQVLLITVWAVGPLLALTVLALNAKGFGIEAVRQYPELVDHLAKTVLSIRQKLPESLAKHLPDGAQALQLMLAEGMKAHVGTIATTGKHWLHGLLLAYVGWVVGGLMALARPVRQGPLALSIRRRAVLFSETFSQIITAQFWIAALNATLTALFLKLVLPLFDVEMPYAVALIIFTFVAGLVPIVGNLVCNVVLTLVGVSVSPLVALSCLLFLIGIHKFEYIINAKVVGSKTSIGAWELLLVMFSLEALFGVAGLVCAPLYYAYFKKEFSEAGWV